MCCSLLSPWFDKNSMDITGSWSGFKWWYPGVWFEDTWVEFGVCCFNNRELPFKVIVFQLRMFYRIFFSGIYLVAVPALNVKPISVFAAISLAVAFKRRKVDYR